MKLLYSLLRRETIQEMKKKSRKWLITMKMKMTSEMKKIYRK